MTHNHTHAHVIYDRTKLESSHIEQILCRADTGTHNHTHVHIIYSGTQTQDWNRLTSSSRFPSVQGHSHGPGHDHDNHLGRLVTLNFNVTGPVATAAATRGALVHLTKQGLAYITPLFNDRSTISPLTSSVMSSVSHKLLDNMSARAPYWRLVPDAGLSFALPQAAPLAAIGVSWDCHDLVLVTRRGKVMQCLTKDATTHASDKQFEDVTRYGASGQGRLEAADGLVLTRGSGSDVVPTRLRKRLRLLAEKEALASAFKAHCNAASAELMRLGHALTFAALASTLWPMTLNNVTRVHDQVVARYRGSELTTRASDITGDDNEGGSGGSSSGHVGSGSCAGDSGLVGADSGIQHKLRITPAPHSHEVGWVGGWVGEF